MKRIWFEEEKKPYKVRCHNERYAICTKPYNFRPETVIYTIVDFQEKIRGTDFYSIGPYDYYTQEDCDNALQDLINGEMEISYRNRIELKIKNLE